MNNDIKIAKNYSPSKMQRSIMLMEQFWLLSQNKELSEDKRKCAKGLFEHYRRLAMCILMKEFTETLSTELMIDEEYMDNIYRKYTV